MESQANLSPTALFDGEDKENSTGNVEIILSFL
jgi:hypothetical protein